MTSGTPPGDLAAAFARATVLYPVPPRLLWFERIGSTNDVASRLAADGAPDGTTVVADEQTSGRGRLGRVWASPPGAGLYMSVVLRPRPDVARLLTIAAGVAVADGVAASTGLAPALKWPNDVYVGGRKLAGLLAEGSALASDSERTQPAVVIGIGLNLHPGAYPPEVARRATSLEGELGRAVDRLAVFEACIGALARRYQQLPYNAAGVIDAWRDHAAPLLRRRVQFEQGGATVSGIAYDVDDSGALLVQAGGEVVRVVSGEVRWD